MKLFLRKFLLFRSPFIFIKRNTQLELMPIVSSIQETSIQPYCSKDLSLSLFSGLAIVSKKQGNKVTWMKLPTCFNTLEISFLPWIDKYAH